MNQYHQYQIRDMLLSINHKKLSNEELHHVKKYVNTPVITYENMHFIANALDMKVDELLAKKSITADDFAEFKNLNVEQRDKINRIIDFMFIAAENIAIYEENNDELRNFNQELIDEQELIHEQEFYD